MGAINYYKPKEKNLEKFLLFEKKKEQEQKEEKE